jgi:hypothetical protein
MTHEFKYTPVPSHYSEAQQLCVPTMDILNSHYSRETQDDFGFYNKPREGKVTVLNTFTYRNNFVSFALLCNEISPVIKRQRTP